MNARDELAAAISGMRFAILALRYTALARARGKPLPTAETLDSEADALVAITDRLGDLMARY